MAVKIGAGQGTFPADGQGVAVHRPSSKNLKRCSKTVASLSALAQSDFEPEPTLVAAPFRLDVEEVNDQCTIKKIGPGSAAVRNRVEHQPRCCIEYRLIMITEAAG